MGFYDTFIWICGSLSRQELRSRAENTSALVTETKRRGRNYRRKISVTEVADATSGVELSICPRRPADVTRSHYLRTVRPYTRRYY